MMRKYVKQYRGDSKMPRYWPHGAASITEAEAEFVKAVKAGLYHKPGECGPVEVRLELWEYKYGEPDVFIGETTVRATADV